MKPLLALMSLLVGILLVAEVPARFAPRVVPVSMLEITMPPTANAGETVEATITSDPGTAVTVVFSSGYGSMRREITMPSTTVRVVVPLTEHAGRLEAIAVAGDRMDATGTEIVPGPVAGPPNPLIGARSIVADGVDRAMVVVIPEDEHGNPALTGTPVAVVVQHPDGSHVAGTLQVSPTLLWSWVTSVTTAGSATVTARAGGVTSGGRTLLEIPATPAPFALTAESAFRPADGTSLVTVTSGPLADGNGNDLLDGTSAVVRVDYPDGTMSIQTVVTVGGIARALLEAPAAPGVVGVEMVVQGTRSERLELDFHPASVPGQASPPPSGVVTIRPARSTP